MRRVRCAAAAPAASGAPRQRSPLAPRGGGGVELAGQGARLDSARDLERASHGEAAVRVAARTPGQG